MWGEGLDLILELDEGSLKLLESDTGRVLNSQPIHAIRFADILYSSNFKGVFATNNIFPSLRYFILWILCD